MPKMTFVCEHPNFFKKEGNLAKITYESNRETLDDIIEDFEDFLRGSGFLVDGRLEVVNYESEDSVETFTTMNDSFPISEETITITTGNSDYYYDINRNR